MKAGWKKVKFSDLFNDPKKAIISGPFGSNLKSSEYQNEGVPLVRLQNVDRWNFINKNIIYITPEKAEELSSHAYKAGDILISKLGAPLGKACIAPESSGEGIVLADIVRVRVDDNSHNKEFIVYQLNSEDISMQLKALTTGATRPRVTLKSVRELNFVIPPLTEQKQIVAILDKAFAAIDQAKAHIEKNIQNAQELFQSKLNEIFSHPSTGDTLSQSKCSGQAGEGWDEKPLGDVCENLDSQRKPITKNKRISGNIPYYGASGIVDYVEGYLFDDDLLLVSEDGANLLARTYPIAFSISGKSWVNNHAHVLKFDNLVSQKFVEIYLNSIKLDEYISGMAQPKLNQKKLNSIPIPYHYCPVNWNNLKRMT